MFQDIQSEASKELEPAHLYLFWSPRKCHKMNKKTAHGLPDFLEEIGRGQPSPFLIEC